MMSTPSDTLSLSILVGLLQKPRDDRTVREQRCIDDIEDTLRKCQLKYIVHFDGDPGSMENEEAIAEMMRLHGFSRDDRMPLLGEEHGWSGSCHDW